ncbi:hypothetical protein BDW69DRAFT_70112 [Aspergillus filifer]
MPLSELCPATNQPHGNAWSCGSCLATSEPSRPQQTRTRLSQYHTSHQQPCTEPETYHEREVISLLDDTPPSSPRKALQVFASPPKQSPTRRFQHYNRTEGAEQYRQESISRTRGVTVQGTAVKVEFHLLVRKRIHGLWKPLSCDLVDICSIRLYPRTVTSYKDFIECCLIREMKKDAYKLQDRDDLRLATAIQSQLYPVYLQQSYDGAQQVSRPRSRDRP